MDVTLLKYSLLSIHGYLLWYIPLQLSHNGRDGISNHQPHGCLLSRLFRRRSKKTSKLRVTGLCAGNSPVTGEFPEQMVSSAKNVSIWWRHHASIPYNNTGLPHIVGCLIIFCGCDSGSYGSRSGRGGDSSCGNGNSSSRSRSSSSNSILFPTK